MITVPIRENDINDLHARYKMPDLELRTKHNLTYLLNLSEIAKSLKVSPDSLAKYLGNGLSTMTKYSEKNRELQINGLHGKDLIMKEVRKFIKEYILCPTCDYPELDYLPKKKAMKIKCRACGFSGKADLDDKINKIIHQYEINNPKNAIKIKEKIKERALKEVTVEQSETASPEQSIDFKFEFDEDDDVIDMPSDDEWVTDCSPDAIEARRQEIDSEALKKIFQ